MSNNNQQPQTQRPSRADEERTARRRRQDLGEGRLRNLSVEGTKDPNYVYRWINDDPGRVHKLTVMDDWDRVTNADLGLRDDRDKNVGAGVERIVDKVTGKRAVLVRKRKDYYAEDKAKEQAQLDETDAALQRGQSRSPEGLQGPHAYIPAEGISIRDGRRG